MRGRERGRAAALCLRPGRTGCGRQPPDGGALRGLQFDVSRDGRAEICGGDAYTFDRLGAERRTSFPPQSFRRWRFCRDGQGACAPPARDDARDAGRSGIGVIRGRRDLCARGTCPGWRDFARGGYGACACAGETRRSRFGRSRVAAL